MTPHFGKLLILAGAVLVAVGVILSLNVHLPWLGRLPGDIAVKKDSFSFYFPLTTCILMSLVLSLLLYLFRR